MRVLIIGNGVVGGTLRRWLNIQTNHEIFIYDPPQGHDEMPAIPIDIALISVPVPTKGFEQDLSLVYEVIDKLQETQSDWGCTIVLRSTVLPGTCERLTAKYGYYVHAMPEFLTERKCDEDFHNQPVIVGLAHEIDVKSDDADYHLRKFKDLFDGKKELRICNSKVAEMTKYAHNVFGALKVTYFNGIARLCELEGIKYDAVHKLCLTSGYINDQHMQVPGPDGQKGFGGTCFPKDLEAFIGYTDNKCEHMLLKDILCLNRFYRGIKEIPDGGAQEQQGT